MSCIVSDHTQIYNGSKQRLKTTAQSKGSQTNKQWQKKVPQERSLREFKPESYKVWEMSTKATLKYNKLLNIVDGTETNPTPHDDDGRVLRPFSATTRVQVEKWEHDHERAREAIIRCLPDSELLKLDDVQDDVTAIWKRLSNEYGRASNLEYVRASNDLANLKKDEKTQSTTTSTSLSSLFMTLTTTNRPTQGTWKNRSSTSNFSILSWSIKPRLTNGRPSSTQKALNSRQCPRNSSTQKS